MDVFEAVAEPNRRHLISLLAEREHTAGELVGSLPTLTQPAVSRHLRILREVGLVEVRPDGQRRVYALKPDGLQRIDDWITPYRRFWRDHLAALEQDRGTVARSSNTSGGNESSRTAWSATNSSPTATRHC